ncbi:MAG: hypothetical protein BGO51_22710 [Rhodospirillales bacterium 69-11]|nr:PEP-CTERM system TPR-repeat protein PrsT [Rhodospirillales bacterium]OJW31329.1 MAG: hypothetical protein BGO51_22710 [Rhodospirillales bacterium 69-11]
MRHRLLGALFLGTCLACLPMAAQADSLSNARTSLKKGDLRVAQIELRNAVRADPHNAEAHFWLGRVNLELGDPVAAEREATAARDRGYDPRQSVALLAQALLAQGKYDALLQTLKPDGKDPLVDASILVARGYAELGLGRPDAAQAAFQQAEQAAPDTVEPLLAEARLAIGRGDAAAARDVIDRALARQPKSADALLAKAQVLRMQNDATGALGVLDDLVRDQPDILQARLDRANLLLALGRNDQAKGDIDAVLKASPGSVQGIYLQAVMAAQTRDWPAADKALDRIAAYVARLPRAYYLTAVVKDQLGQYEQAEDAAQKYIDRAPNDLAGYKVLARVQFAKARPDQVIQTLGRITETGKADAETWDLIARAYAATGQSNAAIAAYQKAEALAPTDVGLQTRLASLRLGIGQAETAMDDLEHTLQLAPKMPMVAEALFFASVATGDLSKATDALAKIKAAQGDTEVTENLTGLYQLAQIDLDGARDTFAAVVRKYPDFAAARVNLARVTAMLGDRKDAEQMLADLLARQPAAEPALAMLVATYTQAGRLPDAVALLERARAAEPQNTRLIASLGDLYIRSGAPEKALDLALAQKDRLARSTDVLAMKASAQLARGQKKEARDTYGALLTTDPNLLGARRQLANLLIDASDFQSARNVVLAGIAASPRTYQLYQDLALIDLKANGLDDALATADRLIAQDRDFATLRGLKGDIYLAAKRPEDAITAYRQALASTPDTSLVTRLAGAQLRAHRPDDAQATLRSWLDTHPDDTMVLQQLSEIEIGRDRLADAAKLIEKLLALKPHDPVALNNLGWTYQQIDDPRAQEMARQAYVLSPNAQSADTLGWILVSKGQNPTGLALLRQANAEDGNDPHIQYHLAVALARAGQKEEATKLLGLAIATKSAFREKAEAQKLLDDIAKGS